MKDYIQSLGYTWFQNDTRPYNLNIVAERHGYDRINQFNDWLYVFWKGGFGKEVHERWRISTLPGQPWLENPLNPAGCAVLLPGQYSGAYALGLYKGYTALRQVKPVSIYRDNNKDLQIDKHSATIETGLFGIHIHRAGFMSSLVGLASAGCQVFQNRHDYDQFIDLCVKAKHYWGNSFTYTLIEV